MSVTHLSRLAFLIRLTADLADQVTRLAYRHARRAARDAYYTARANHFHPGFADVDPDTGTFEVVHYSATSRRMAPCVGSRCDFCRHTASLAEMADAPEFVEAHTAA